MIGGEDAHLEAAYEERFMFDDEPECFFDECFFDEEDDA